ncbi:MAG: ABC transporter permease [Bdellovibrio sp.]
MRAAGKRGLDLFGLPALLWFCFFLLGPLLQVFWLTFQRRGLYGGVEFSISLQNYVRSLNPIYFEILLKSLVLASLTSVICLGLALPLAWGLTSFSMRKKKLLLIFLAVPFFMNMIARIYSLKTLLHVDGPIARVLALLGIEGELLNLSQNFPLVMYGLVTSYLPYMLLPIWIQLEKTDPALIESAMDLGRSPPKMSFQKKCFARKGDLSCRLSCVDSPSVSQFVFKSNLFRGEEIFPSATKRA